MKKTVLFSIIISLSLSAFGQTVSPDLAIDNFTKQLSVFPQEKIYVQSDKPYYLGGEKMFFRIFLLNAATGEPAWFSRYVYVELINPVDSVVIRQQIRPEESLFYGALSLPVELPQGNYTLRAYTRYMENFGEKFFYTRQIFIASPNALRFEMQTEFEYFDDKETGVSLRFLDKTTKEVKHPDRISLRLNEKKQTLLKPDKNGWVNIKFRLDENENKRVFTVGYGEDIRLFETYLYIPFNDNNIDITFYPEGGNIIAGQPCKIAFKALSANGNSTAVNGEIYSSKDEFVTKFEGRHDGMGYFNLLPQKGEKYYSKCEYNNTTYRFDLPDVQTQTYSLKTAWNNERLFVSVNKHADMAVSKLYLLIHGRGNLMYFDEWDFAKNQIIIAKNDLFTGVQHLMLLAEDFQPVSERLVFVNKGDWITSEVSTEKRDYAKREYVKLDVQLKNINTDTIKRNFAISVTDDSDVIIDTTTNILAEILLSSELKGRVNNPAYYFENNDEETNKIADLLMLTQGWNRYNIPEILRGKIQIPQIIPETGQTITGNVTNNFSKPYRNAQVKIFSPNEGFFAETETDANGNFVISDFEYPDSTAYAVQALTRKGKGSVLLKLNNITYPKAVSPYIFTAKEKNRITETDTTDFMDYVENTNAKYSGDIAWVLNIEASIVTAKKTEKKEPPKTYYGFFPDDAITQEDLERFPPTDIYNLLARLPGVIVNGKDVRILRSMRSSLIRKNAGIPLFIVDGVPLFSPDDNASAYNISPIDDINVHEIKQINLIKTVARLVIYGQEGSDGVIEIITKSGKYVEPPAKLNIKTLLPLGYSLPAEFYSPKYDTPEALNNKKADIRSTIYWKPDILTNNEGKASISFYTADSPTAYSVVMEGISADGKIIYHRKRRIINVK